MQYFASVLDAAGSGSKNVKLMLLRWRIEFLVFAFKAQETQLFRYFSPIKLASCLHPYAVTWREKLRVPVGKSL